MWEKTYSKTFQGIKKEDVWRVLSDINNWQKWQCDLDECRIEGSFEVGNLFWLKPKGAKPVKIVLTAVDQGKAFTDCTCFFGAKMYDTHRLEETALGLRVTHTLTVTGPLKWLWVNLVVKSIASTVPEQTESLIAFVQKLNNGT